ncbi:MAG: hypothetical protein IJ679_01015 [Lachnospiraceae bacterium]|nr:hypothetical protein [Lachnospiraceae bacterium]
MKHYVLVGSFKKNPSEVADFKSIMGEHHSYLKDHKDKGDVLLSGPKAEGGGGVILIRTDDIQRFIEADPLFKAGIQEYQAVEFEIFDGQD